MQGDHSNGYAKKFFYQTLYHDGHRNSVYRDLCWFLPA